MDKKTLIIVGGIVVLIGIIAATLALGKHDVAITDSNLGTQEASSSTDTTASVGKTTASSTATSTSQTQPTSFTLAEVATHNSQTSCYTAINGSVYDVTSWINQHPGGAAAILSLCGIDGSAAFNNQHGGQRRPEQELATFKIGTLAK